MNVDDFDVMRIKIFLRLYAEHLKKNGKPSDQYAVDVIDDLLGRL